MRLFNFRSSLVSSYGTAPAYLLARYRARARRAATSHHLLRSLGRSSFHQSRVPGRSPWASRGGVRGPEDGLRQRDSQRPA